MVPKATASLEQLPRGDTAIVAIQYSFLPSVLAIFMDPGLANEAGITLFNAVRARWSKLPPDRRPKLVLFGKSLDAVGRSVRFLNRDPHQAALDADWSAPRIVYLQHPADPAVFWSAKALWWPPEWMARPRGFDVPDAMRWFPIVSGVQAVGDLLNQLGVPPGFGHDHSTEYVRGWASVDLPTAGPTPTLNGWSNSSTRSLDDDSEP